MPYFEIYNTPYEKVGGISKLRHLVTVCELTLGDNGAYISKLIKVVLHL